jgi:hypothetical protein
MTTTARLAQYLPARENVASALGLRPAPRPRLAGLGFFGTGLIVGSALALLLSPRNGPQIRGDLRRGLARARKRLNSARPNGEDQERAQL